MYVDLKTWLVNDILVKVDRMSMASSLEVRSPLLDHEVIELAASLPSTLKFRDGVSKYLLKRYAERHAPASVVHRPKKGFTIPLAEWLRGPLRSTAAELLLSERARHRGYFDAGAVRSLWAQHDRRQRDRAHQIWTLMMLELWHRMFLDQTPPLSAPRVLP
jgi:asparagine synthase (glutamine-hydrolysing)